MSTRKKESNDTGEQTDRQAYRLKQRETNRQTYLDAAKEMDQVYA